jgi:hypothetical protein
MFRQGATFTMEASNPSTPAVQVQVHPKEVTLFTFAQGGGGKVGEWVGMYVDETNSGYI